MATEISLARFSTGPYASLPAASVDSLGWLFWADDRGTLYLCTAGLTGTPAWVAVSTGMYPAVVKASVRCVVASPAAYTVDSTKRIITANANGALGAHDGVTLVAGEDCLVADGTADAGIYRVGSAGGASAKWTMTRRTDADCSDEIRSGMLVPISEGTSYGNKLMQLTTNDPITMGTTALVFAAPALVAATESAHTHAVGSITSPTSGTPSATETPGSATHTHTGPSHTHGATGLTATDAGHTHNAGAISFGGTIDSESAHTHAAGAISFGGTIDNESSHTHAAGAISFGGTIDNESSHTHAAGAITMGGNTAAGSSHSHTAGAITVAKVRVQEYLGPVPLTGNAVHAQFAAGSAIDTAAGIATCEIPYRNVQIARGGAGAATVYTVDGTDPFGAAQSENINSNGATTVQGTKAWATITRLRSDVDPTVTTDFQFGKGVALSGPFSDMDLVAVSAAAGGIAAAEAAEATYAAGGVVVLTTAPDGTKCFWVRYRVLPTATAADTASESSHTHASTGLTASGAATAAGSSHSHGYTGLTASGAATAAGSAHSHGYTGLTASGAATAAGSAHAHGYTGLTASGAATASGTASVSMGGSTAADGTGATGTPSATVTVGGGSHTHAGGACTGTTAAGSAHTHTIS